MCFVDKVRLYTKTMPLEDAVEQAITECIRDDILAEFLRNNKAEAKSVSIFEYDEEQHMRQIREEGENQMLDLISQMIADGKVEDIPRLKEDKKFLEEMIAKYQKK